jgi:hypothetical protein
LACGCQLLFKMILDRSKLDQLLPHGRQFGRLLGNCLGAILVLSPQGFALFLNHPDRRLKGCKKRLELLRVIDVIRRTLARLRLQRLDQAIEVTDKLLFGQPKTLFLAR